MKRKVLISECTCEDIVAEDIYNPHGMLLLPKGTAVNKYLIQRLAELGVGYVWVSKRKYSDSLLDKNYSLFEKKFKTNVDDMRRVVVGLVKGERLDYTSIKKLTENIISSRQEPEYIARCLLQIRIADSQTYQHCINVSFYAMLLSGWLNLSREDIFIATQAGLLHDLGKAKISEELLNKSEKLTTEEMDELHRHTLYGYDLVKDNPEITEEIKDAVLMHHEREDGSGYPLGIRGEHMNMYTKIVAVVDMYDAMISERPYKKALMPFDAFEEFLTFCRGRLDAYIVNTLIYNLSRYYTGSKVLLSNGKSGNIAYVPPHCIWKPVIDTGTEFLDLSRERDIYIADMA